MSLSTLSTTMILWLFLLAWLTTCVVYDLRIRQVPTVLTLLPLVISAIYRLILGGWTMVCLVLVLILVSDLPKAGWRIPLGSFAAVLALLIPGSFELIYAKLAILTIWVLWESGATGGADAKIIITLVLLFNNGLLFILINLVGGIQGLIGLIARRKSIPYTVAITLGTVTWLSLLNYR